jgi:hypothetical protein
MLCMTSEKQLVCSPSLLKCIISRQNLLQGISQVVQISHSFCSYLIQGCCGEGMHSVRTGSALVIALCDQECYIGAYSILSVTQRLSPGNHLALIQIILHILSPELTRDLKIELGPHHHAQSCQYFCFYLGLSASICHGDLPNLDLFWNFDHSRWLGELWMS